jgi:hypothetical protein
MQSRRPSGLYGPIPVNGLMQAGTRPMAPWISLDMFPTPTSPNCPHVASLNAEFSRNYRRWPFISSDSPNHFVSQFRHAIHFASAGPTPALGGHIFHIVVIGSEPHVVGIDASTVVAAMENEEPFGDGANASFIRDSVDEFLPVSNRHDAVAAGIFVSAPLDTTGFGNDSTIFEGMMNFSHVNVAPFGWLGLRREVRVLPGSAF